MRASISSSLHGRFPLRWIALIRDNVNVVTEPDELDGRVEEERKKAL